MNAPLAVPLTLTLTLTLVACSPALGPAPPDADPRPDRAERARDALLAATAEGGVARVDAVTGAVLAATAPAGAPIRDVVWDPWEGAAAFVVGDDDETWSEWRLAPLDGEAEPWGIASTDGRARVEVVAGGWVLFEHGSAGPAWRFLPRDGAPAASVGAPEPRSPAASDGERVCALGWVDEALSLRCAPLDDGGFGPSEEDALAPSLAPRPTARLVSLDPPLALDLVGGLLAVRDLAEGSVVPAAGPAPLARIDDARRLADGRIAALVTPDAPGALEAQPARLVVVDPVARSVDWLALPEPAVLADTFYRRALVELDGRLLVALDASVVAVDLDTLALDAGFDGAGLRGPISRRPG